MARKFYQVSLPAKECEAAYEHGVSLFFFRYDKEFPNKVELKGYAFDSENNYIAEFGGEGGVHLKKTGNHHEDLEMDNVTFFNILMLRKEVLDSKGFTCDEDWIFTPEKYEGGGNFVSYKVSQGAALEAISLNPCPPARPE